MPRDRLPHELPGAATRGHVLLVLAIALATVVLLNLLAARLLAHHTTNRGYWLVRAKWDLLSNLPAPVDWLVLGDSSCNQGVIPEVLAEQLGGSALNACTVGDMLAVNDAWMLARHIERHGPPRHVVLVHVYDMWHRDQRALVHQPLLAKIPLPWAYWRSAAPSLDLTGAQERKLWVARHLPLWADNQTLASWLRHPRRLWQRDLSLTADGFMAHDQANPASVRRDSKAHLAALHPHRFTLSQINRRALEHIRDLADQRGFDVYLAAGPLHDGLWRDPRFRDHFADLMHTLEGLASHSPRMRVVLPEPVTFPAHSLESADHPVGPAAREYTDELVAAIRRAAAR